MLLLAPSPPSHLDVSQNGPDSVLVSWRAPSEEPAVTGYVIYYQQQDGDQNLTESAATTANITGLTVGATYSFTMVATSSTLPSTETAALNITIGKYKTAFNSEILCSSTVKDYVT